MALSPWPAPAADTEAIDLLGHDFKTFFTRQRSRVRVGKGDGSSALGKASARP